MIVSAVPPATWCLVRGDGHVAGGAPQPHFSQAAGSVARATCFAATLERIVGSDRSDPLSGDLARAAARRLLSHVQRLNLPARHLWSIVDRAGTVSGGVLVIPSAGRSAQVIASRPGHPDEVGMVAAAIAAASNSLLASEATIAQALLEGSSDTRGAPLPHDTGLPGPPDTRVRNGSDLLLAAFLEAGFTRLATLDYLSRPLPRRGEFPKPHLPPEVTIDPWRKDDPSILRVLEESYRGTLDCPGLRGLRRTEDILAGHLAAGRLLHGLWSILSVDGSPAGAALLSPSHGGEDVDLVYLGLSERVRGRGLGRLLLQHGLHQLAGRRERRVALAVDRANAPAVSLYRSMGFAGVGSRLALVKPLHAP